MHKHNKHQNPYNFKALVKVNSDLKPFVITNRHNSTTIDFSNPEAVYQLNKAILILDYNLTDYHLPKGYLCPPIPGRADYIHHLHDLIDNKISNVRGLDIGVGANVIYPILASQIYDWKMVGCDIHPDAIKIAMKNIRLTKGLSNLIDIRYQDNPANIFKGILKPNEYYNFTICNPPFHASEQDAIKGTQRKWKNLKGESVSNLNFGGLSHELWCNGGEALFIKRMIKESIKYKNQVGWFTTLVAKGSHLPRLIKQLNKQNACHKIIDMTQGQKQSRILAWHYRD